MSFGALTTEQIERLIRLDRTRRERGLLGVSSSVQTLFQTLQEQDRFGNDMEERLHQAQRLWNAGWGRALGYERFDDYLATIPPVPIYAATVRSIYPLWVLVDARVSLRSMCVCLGIDLSERDCPADATRPLGAVYWVRCQDGKRYQGRSVQENLLLFGAHERAMTAMEGVCLFAQFPMSTQSAYLDLAGSHHEYSPDTIACLGMWRGRMALRWRWSSLAHPDCGTATCVKERI